MTDLDDDYQFELSGVPFGIWQRVSCTAEGFRPGDPGLTASVAPNPTSNGSLPGRDFEGSAIWGFDLFADQDNATDALDATAELRRVWRREETYEIPGAFDTLRYRIAGRTRRIYGRGRRWTATPGNRLSQGFIPITADFEQLDPLIYGDDRRTSGPLTLVGAPPADGIEAPLTAPLTGAGGEEPRYGEITVGGEAPTWAIVTFTGYSVNAYVEVAGWRIEFDDTVGDNDAVVVDGRPLVRSALRNGTGRMKMSNLSRIGGMRLPVGTHTISFGADASSGGTFEVSWYDAYKSI